MFNESIMNNLDELYQIPYISYSQLNTYLTCPHSYYLTYMSGKFEFNSNKYTELGSLLHDIYERQGKQLLSDPDEPLTEHEALRIFNDKFFKIDKVHFDDKEDWLKMYRKGVEAIKNYYATYNHDTPLFVERKFMGKLADGLPQAKSFVDRIDGKPDDPSTWIITDYKTGSSPKTKSYLRDDIQLGFYASQVFALYGEYPQAVQFYHPVPNKFQTAVHQGDGVYRFTNQREPVVEFSVADTIQKIRETVYQIVTDEEFKKAPDKWKCGFCWHYQSGRCKPFSKEQEGWANL
jgi:RecB family exonuclease